MYCDYNDLTKQRDSMQLVEFDFISKWPRGGSADIRGNEQGRKNTRQTALDTVSCD